MPSLFETSQANFQQAHGGGSRRGPGGHTQAPTNQAQALHSAGMDSLHRSLASQQVRAQQSALQQEIHHHNIRERVQQNARAFNLGVQINHATGPFLNPTSPNRPFTKQGKSFSVRTEEMWDSYVSYWGYLKPESLKRIYVTPQIEVAKSTGFFLRDHTPSIISDAIDGGSLLSLDAFAVRRFNRVHGLNDKDKKMIFDTSSVLSTSILLDEFALGTGPEHRHFYPNQKITKDFLTGYVIEDVINGFYREISGKRITYDNFLVSREAIRYGLRFSPDGIDLKESIRRHKQSNEIQLFVGGANIIARPSSKPGYVNFEIENRTSRSSLLLHVPKNEYVRQHDDAAPLSTIYQHFHFSLRIDTERFYEDKASRDAANLNKPKRLY